MSVLRWAIRCRVQSTRCVSRRSWLRRWLCRPSVMPLLCPRCRLPLPRAGWRRLTGRWWPWSVCVWRRHGRCASLSTLDVSQFALSRRTVPLPLLAARRLSSLCCPHRLLWRSTQQLVSCRRSLIDLHTNSNYHRMEYVLWLKTFRGNCKMGSR